MPFPRRWRVHTLYGTYFSLSRVPRGENFCHFQTAFFHACIMGGHDGGTHTKPTPGPWPHAAVW